MFVAILVADCANDTILDYQHGTMHVELAIARGNLVIVVDESDAWLGPALRPPVWCVASNSNVLIVPTVVGSLLPVTLIRERAQL